jgi:hypothetical protein
MAHPIVPAALLPPVARKRIIANLSSSTRQSIYARRVLRHWD